jgi:hypothetical protein
MSTKPEYTVTTAPPESPDQETYGTSAPTLASGAHAYGEACRKWPTRVVRLKKNGVNVLVSHADRVKA